MELAIREAASKHGVSIKVRPDGRIDVSDYSGGTIDEDEIKSTVMKAYSKQIVLTQAKRFGWAVKQKPDGTFQVQKARF